MAEQEDDSLIRNISTFFNRLRGEKVLRTTDKLTILNTPETERERQAKNKITSLTQFVRNKNWNRRHTEFFDEYRRMVYTYPIIKAAIDIYGEECISRDTSLFLLDGTEREIGDLYDKQIKNFWLYGINPVTKEVIPVQCEKVIHKGKRQVGELTCDDGTKIKCTPNHKFLLTSGEWVEAKDLTLGDSLQSLYTRKDSKGYLEVSNGTVAKRSQRRSWKKVHSIVGNTILKEQKEELKGKYEASQDNMKVIHHKSFNKLNNDPSELEWMLWEDHRQLHNDLNTSRWENEDFSKRMGKLASERLKKNWANPEWKKVHSEKYSNTYKAKIAKMSPEERLSEFSRPGEQNGMYGVSRKGKTNPNANPNYNHIEDIDFDMYLNLLQLGTTLLGLRSIFNISETTERQLYTLAKEKLHLNTRGLIFLSALANNSKKNIKTTKEEVLSKVKAKKIKAEEFQLLGYKNQEDFVENVFLNHRVVGFTLLESEEDVYDVVNAGKFHNYAIKCNEGMIISHNCTITNKEGNIISIECSDNKIKKELEELFFETLKINTKGSLITREICKFGNCYAYISVREGDGVVDLTFLPPETIVREQMYDPQNIDLYRFLWLGASGGSSYYEPWEIVHWKNVEDIEMEPYGVSILRCILDTYRRVILMREALVVYRITRAPQKLLFKIATDGMGGAEAMQYAQEIKKQVSKKSLVDPKTGELDFKHNFINIEENYFMPTSEGSPTDVSVLDGASNLDAVEDYKIIKDDLFAGLKIPKAYLTFDEDINAKATLSAEDARFSRVIKRVQSQLIEGLVHVGVVHLFSKGYSKKELQSFKIKMESPSTVDEKARNEILIARLDLAKSAWDANNNSLNLMSYVDVLRTVLNFSTEEIKQTIKSQMIEKKIMWRLQQLRENGVYIDPELDQKLAIMKGLTGESNSENQPKGFDALEFEGESLTETVKRKIDEELGDLIKPTEGKASIQQVNLFEDHGEMFKSAMQTKKDLGTDF